MISAGPFLAWLAEAAALRGNAIGALANESSYYGCGKVTKCPPKEVITSAIWWERHHLLGNFLVLN